MYSVHIIFRYWTQKLGLLTGGCSRPGVFLLLRKLKSFTCMLSHSVVSDSLRPRGLQPTSLLCPWDFSEKILESVAMSSSRGSSWHKDQIQVSWFFCIGRRILYHWATTQRISISVIVTWSKLCWICLYGTSPDTSKYNKLPLHELRLQWSGQAPEVGGWWTTVGSVLFTVQLGIQSRCLFISQTKKQQSRDHVTDKELLH